MSATAQTKCLLGVPGLDSILGGGLPPNCLYLIEGNPGVGKTTLALQFLLEGVRGNERCLYVTLSETKQELEAVAYSHGWILRDMEIIELSAIEQIMTGKSSNTLFQSAEVELNHFTKLLLDEVERIKPSRVVIDSLSELRLLAQNPLRYRRQILSLKQHFAERGCTVLLLDDRSAAGSDLHVQSIVHGMISLEMSLLKFGIFRRSLSVTKLRATSFREGSHDYVIQRGGLVVFPRLVASEHGVRFGKALISSNNKQLDALTGGGLHEGTSNLLMGPAGSGKSTLATIFAHAALERGQHVQYYAFDESAHILRARAREMRLDLDPHIKGGGLRLRQIDPAQISPGELAHDIVRSVDTENTRVVVLDSLNGYIKSMPNEEFMSLHLHELLTYLNQQGITTIMILAQHGLIDMSGAPVDVSYLADTVVLTRFFEAHGDVKKAISVIKKRSGPHETTIRELIMRPDGLEIGPPLLDFQGVLTGVPAYLGKDINVLDHR